MNTEQRYLRKLKLQSQKESNDYKTYHENQIQAILVGLAIVPVAMVGAAISVSIISFLYETVIARDQAFAGWLLWDEIMFGFGAFLPTVLFIAYFFAPRDHWLKASIIGALWVALLMQLTATYYLRLYNHPNHWHTYLWFLMAAMAYPIGLGYFWSCRFRKLPVDDEDV